MKHRVIITENALHTIIHDVIEANNNYETGGVLIGYNLGWIYLVVAATTQNTDNIRSMVSFLLDGAEHTRKANAIISSFSCSPSVLGIWHSHICDGHKFSKQDILSNKVLAKSLGGALSMLVTKSANAIVLSISHISTTGTEKDCVITARARFAETEVKLYERR